MSTWSSNTQEVGKGGSRVSEVSLGYLGHSRPSRATKMPRSYTKFCLGFSLRWRPLAPVVPVGTNPMPYCMWCLQLHLQKEQQEWRWGATSASTPEAWRQAAAITSGRRLSQGSAVLHTLPSALNPQLWEAQSDRFPLRSRCSCN